MNEKDAVLEEVRELVERKNWVTFDTETTSLQGEIISWAVCDGASGILGQGLVKPTVRVSPEAYRFHGISDEMLEDAPDFWTACHMIFALLDGKEVVIYNADFDINRLATSLYAHAKERDVTPYIQWLRTLVSSCAMEWFAVIYGEWSDYHGSYTYQSLSTACHYFDISFPEHQAADDARATAELVKRMYEMAKLPDYNEEREDLCKRNRVNLSQHPTTFHTRGEVSTSQI